MPTLLDKPRSLAIVPSTDEGLPSLVSSPTGPEEDTLEADLLDWDGTIETPPSRPVKSLKARFIYAGKRPPQIVDDPRD